MKRVGEHVNKEVMSGRELVDSQFAFEIKCGH